jgi:hypothetical protein
MTNKFYKCDDCNRRFSRNWNALRHNKLKHSNSAQISNDNIGAKGSSHRSHNKYYDYKLKFNVLEQVESEINDNQLDMYFSDFFSPNPIDIKIIKIIDQLIRPFEELEALLGPIGEKTKATILLNSLYSCLQTHNPVNSMNETVELYRSMKGIKKIAYYMSKVDRESSKDPILILKEKIQHSHIFKRQNN